MNANHPLVQGVILAAVVAAATFAANRASSDDVVRAVKAHAEHPHAATAAAELRSASTDARQDAELAKLESTPADIRGITARIDLIVLSGAERSPKRFRRAAAKIRNAAHERGEADPLAGLEGL